MTKTIAEQIEDIKATLAALEAEVAVAPAPERKRRVRQTGHAKGIGGAVRLFREKAGLKVSQLADLSDVPTSSIHGMERRNHYNGSLHNLARIARALDVPLFTMIAHAEAELLPPTPPSSTEGSVIGVLPVA